MAGIDYKPEVTLGEVLQVALTVIAFFVGFVPWLRARHSRRHPIQVRVIHGEALRWRINLSSEGTHYFELQLMTRTPRPLRTVTLRVAQSRRFAIDGDASRMALGSAPERFAVIEGTLVPIGFQFDGDDVEYSFSTGTFPWLPETSISFGVCVSVRALPCYATLQVICRAPGEFTAVGTIPIAADGEARQPAATRA